MQQQPASRRTVLRGAALVGAAGLGTAACSTDAEPDDKGPATPTAPVELGASSEVPVGGATLYREDKLVVAQPSKDHFTAFSAVCTHAGCVLDKIDGDEARCPCHGSRFDAMTGAVRHGPATAALAAVPVRAAGGKLIAGPKA